MPRIAFALCLVGVSLSSAGPPRPRQGDARPATVRDPIAGWWRGHAVFRDASLELAVHFIQEDTKLEGTLSSPDMMLLEEPLDGVQRQGRNLHFATRDERPLRFDGALDGDSIRGSALVPAVPGVVRPDPAASPTLRFALSRAAPPGAPPYSTRDVSFPSGHARLVGTLYLPVPVSGPRAGIVLLQGSSSNLRHEYRFFADLFARAGLAVLAFDKRGKGESSGDYGAATYDDLARDAAAAVECLRSQREVDSLRVGVWGLSQGAFIAPLVAARVPSLRFIVAVSAPGMPVGECAAFQDSVRLTSAGFDVADVLRAVSLDRRMLEWLRAKGDERELGALLAEADGTPWQRASSVPARLPSGPVLEGWYWRGRTLDPAPWWRAVRVPVLAIYGAADELVPANVSSKRVGRALRKSGVRDVTVRVFPAANHMLRTLPLVAGGKWDWPRAAPGYLELLTEWVLEHSQATTR